MNDGPSRHLSWAELACRDGTPFPEEWKVSRALELAELAAAFERVRYLWGGPLLVSSGYRSPEWNRRIGGARRSQHVEGRALDLSPPRNSPQGNLVRLRGIVLEAREQGYLQGVGIYNGFVHIDIRARRATWYGSRTLQDQYS